MDLSNSRLCVFCRCLEPKNTPCPYLSNERSPAISSAGPLAKTEPWTKKDEDLLQQLQQQPSSFCKRCADFDILRVFNEAQPKDSAQIVEQDNDGQAAYYESQEKYRLRLGLLSAFIFKPTCPLCRRIYRLLPRPAPDPDTDMLSLKPYRWYVRRDHWETVPQSERAKFATWFGLLSPDVESASGRSFFNSGQNIRTGVMTGEAFALAPKQRAAGEENETYTARRIGGMIDFEHIRKGLDHCQSCHPKACQPKFDKGLLATRMVDVLARKVIDCPDNCDYLALSYVWGGVHPASGALEAGTLPQTIEDAITLTKGLGKRYLWVDALCIDQSPDPTPEQAAAKAKQLQLMHLIYDCATITIFAVAGARSDYGIPGISRPRVPSTEEIIDGESIITVPPQIMAEVQTSVWKTRAWTWQEDCLSTRKLFLTETQYELQCNETLGASYHAEACDAVPDLTWTYISGGKIVAGFVETNNRDFLDRADSVFESILSSYTPRSMTNDDDSLNAFQGALTKFGLAAYPKGFEWGMPLKEFPQSIAWIHDHTVKPKRRTSFPTWSWAGWDGGVRYPSGLIASGTSQSDLVPRMVGINGKEVTLEGWVVTLDIRTEPFSELVVPGSEMAVGCVTERNFRHNNTIPSGRYRCLVAARVKGGTLRNGLIDQQVFLVVLGAEAVSAVEERQTVITVSRLAVEGKDFMEFGPKQATITLK